MGTEPPADEPAFKHDALLYSGQAEFVDATTGFIRGALVSDEDIMVMVTADKVALLRSALGPDAARVRFEDMEVVGRNPARIIPAWEEFFSASARAGRGARGIGEPIWATRTPGEVVESQRHEELINLAFAEAPGWLMCPYDTASLNSAVIREAYRSHPTVAAGGREHASRDYLGTDRIARPDERPLPEPADRPRELTFDPGPLLGVRRFVEEHAAGFGLDERGTEELALAASEVAANSLRHGSGAGTLRLWTEGDSIVCEVHDRGRMDAPLAGRERPRAGAEGGFGLWLVNHLCDLVQVRSLPSGTVVRMHKARAPRAVGASSR